MVRVSCTEGRRPPVGAMRAAARVGSAAGDTKGNAADQQIIGRRLTTTHTPHDANAPAGGDA